MQANQHVSLGYNIYDLPGRSEVPLHTYVRNRNSNLPLCEWTPLLDNMGNRCLIARAGRGVNQDTQDPLCLEGVSKES